MAGIVWLASFPKSGNTWLRAFLANYFTNAQTPLSINDLSKFIYSDGVAAPFEKIAGRPVTNMSAREIHALRPKVHAMYARSSTDTVFVKTHNAIAYLDNVPTINPKVTAGAVYLIRNPLDLSISYGHHFGVPLDRIVVALRSRDAQIITEEDRVHQHLGNWSDHVRSWTTARGLRRHVVRYEDMVLKTLETTRRVVEFLGLPLTLPRLEKAMRFSSFKVLREQEVSDGFIEANKSRHFFRQGKIGEWRHILTAEQVRTIVADHGEVMAEHGYLNKDGRPVF